VNARRHVVAGALFDAAGRVLLAQRPAHKDLPLTWEFPGGKCESGEAPAAALQRELHEELGIEIGEIEPVIAVPWDYGRAPFLLDVRRVRDFRGEPHGREGQALCWAALDELAAIDMPPADRPAVAALRLPPLYAITPEPTADDFLPRLERLFAAGVRLVQLRAKALSDHALRAMAGRAAALAAAHGATLLLNDHAELARELGLGVHLSTASLRRATSRPLPPDRWLGASCHDAAELAHAAAIGADFAVLGPLAATASHPDAAPLGWGRFEELVAEAALPVYALGGVGPADLGAARAAGAQGVAGISAFW